MHRFLSVVLIIVLLASLVPPARAQTPEPVVLLFSFEGAGGSAQGWFYRDEFDQRDDQRVEGFTLFDGYTCDNWCIASSGWQQNKLLTAVYDLGYDVPISQIRMYWMNVTEGGLGRYSRVRVYNSAMQTVYSNQGGLAAAFSGIRTFNVSGAGAGRYVVIHAVHEWTIAVDWVEITVAAGYGVEKASRYTVPLTAEQEIAQIHEPWNEFVAGVRSFAGGDDTLAYVSTSAGGLVHSPTSALVLSIDDFTVDDCQNYGWLPRPLNIAEIVGIGLTLATGGFMDVIAWASSGDYPICNAGALRIGTDLPSLEANDFAMPIMGDIVTLQDSETGRKLYYIATDTGLFIDEGMLLSPGCVMGYTLPLYGRLSVGLIVNSDWAFTGYGVGVIWATDSSDEVESVLEEYKNYPTSDIPCNASTFVQCLNENPRFAFAGSADWSWRFDGSGNRNPSGKSEGLLLDDTGRNNASQALMLNTNNQYSIKIVAHVQHPNNSFTASDLIVSLGTDSHTITLPYSGTEVETVIPLQEYESDLSGGVYTLRVELGADEDGAEVVVSYVCVDDNADPISPLPSCLFTNPGFDSNTGWTLTGADITGGALLLPTSASQSITLAADSYALEFRARGQAGSYPGESISISGSGSVTAIGAVSGVNYWNAQQIDPVSGGQVTGLSFTLGANAGSPSGTITWEIRANNAGLPGTVLQSGTFTPIPSQVNNVPVTNGPTMIPSSTYWIALRPTSSQSGTNYWAWMLAGNIYAGGMRALSTNGGASWSADPAGDYLCAVTLGSVGVTTELAWSLTPSGGAALAGGDQAVVSTWETYSDPFTLSAPATSATFTVSSGSGLDVDYVCLTPGNQPTAPPKTDYPDAKDCNSCPIRLTGDPDHDIVETLQWQDCRARQLYYCDLRILLVDTRDGVLETVRGVGMLGRWLSASATKQLTWFRSAFWYLGGLLNNVALSIQDSIAWSSGANTVIISDAPMGLLDLLGLLISSLRDVLIMTMDSLVNLVSLAIGFLTPIVGTLLDVITSAVAMFTQFITTILEQVGIVQRLIAAVVDGANTASPALIEGAPDCAASPEGLCWGFYILDNTVFSGPVADLLPILAGAATLNLLVWVLGKFKDAFASID